MAETNSGLTYLDARRRRLDRVTRHVVVGSGLLVMLALVLIFFYLLTVVMPLFTSPTVALQTSVPRTTDAHNETDATPSSLMGISDDGALIYRVDHQGNGEFIVLATGQTLSRSTLTATPIIQVAALAGRQPLYALVQASGNVTVVSPFIPVSGNVLPVWRYPLGAQTLDMTTAGQLPRRLALASDAEMPFATAEAWPENIELMAARVTQDNQLRVSALSSLGVRDNARYDLGTAVVDDMVITPRGDRIYTLSGNQLTSWRVDADNLMADAPVTLSSDALSRLALLSGGQSLLVYSTDGKIHQWFDVPTSQGASLTEIRDFPQRETPGMQLVTEAQRRVFATLTPQGELSLFASKQSSALLTQQIVDQAQQLALSPWGRALLVETARHWYAYRVDNPYPDIGWRGLWQKIWYENYPQPDYVWQSTAADDSYQAKFSLVPLLVGSLKAAVYAMLFATPVALAAAIYTACFMTPGMRRWVKPTLEIMGALPTVVVGLIAALWLAPHVEVYLSAILALPLLCTLVVLSVGALVARLPTGGAWLNGREVLLLMPMLLLTIVLACWAGPTVEMALLGQPLYQWLDGSFVQRNALVVGIALGFALVPLLFSLAENALFSVPVRLRQGSLALGATAWQTVWHVVLPSASASIFSALMLSFGRAVGETMIVLMATGNTPVIDEGLFQGLRSLAANIAIEMPEAVMGSGHYRILFLTALVLFLFTFVVNSLAERLRQRYRNNEGEPV